MSSVLEMAERWKKVQSATVCDVQGNRGALSPRLHSLVLGAQLAGPAVTVVVPPGDLLAAEKVLHRLEPGDVLVIAGGGAEIAYWGAGMCRWAMQRGCTGVVVDGYVRDLDYIASWGFPVFALGTVSCAANVAGGGDSNVPVVIGGILIEPGDWLRGDNDGVVVVPHAEAMQVLGAAEAAQPFEDDALDRLSRGVSWQDIYDEHGHLRVWQGNHARQSTD